jgi:hypothetical protein
VALDIGRYGFGNIVFYQGLLDDIGIWNSSLSEAEVLALYLASTEPCTTNVATNCTSLPANLQQGLVGYWPFCGNANDESGNGNDGAVNGATLTEDRFGNANAAYDFDGLDDYIDCGDPTNGDFELTNSGLTISAWVKVPNENNSGISGIVSKSFGSNSLGDYALSINWEVDNYWMAKGYGGFGSSVHSNSTVELNTWKNVTAVVHPDGLMSIYTNGELDNGDNYYDPWESINSAAHLLIGKVNYNFDTNVTDGLHYLVGTLDDIGIWNRALTPEEVQELYTLDACTFTIYDTVYTYETIYDTVTTYVTVTDTLLIDITFTGFEGQPSWLNTVTVFPNPASDHITIDYGNFALMAGYNTIITDAAGATIYSSAVNSQQAYIDINGWGAAGVYYLTIYDASGAAVAVRHIVLE